MEMLIGIVIIIGGITIAVIGIVAWLWTGRHRNGHNKELGDE